MSRPAAELFLRNAVEAGKFGDSEVTELIFDGKKGEDQFASIVNFVSVKLKQENAVKKVDVIVKMQQENELIRELMNTDPQFYNEVLMYNDILPFLGQQVVEELFPQCFYAMASNGDKPAEDVLILQDLRSSGFRLTEERLLLDYDHVLLAVKQLGRFHALSYAAKQCDMETFMGKVNKLKEVRYEKEQREITNKYWTPCLERGILSLIERREYKEVLEKFVALLDDPFTFMKSLVTPEEPIAVLCHGDFCRNNILYKYQDGKPISVKLFDLATARYCSPVIDLSFFIFMNVPSAVRRESWDDVLSAYHDGLSTAVPGTKVPSLDVIKVEMRRKAAYAYFICSFFIPTMMSDEKIEMDAFAMLSQDEIEEMSKSTGGQEATDAVVAVLEDLILKKCL